MSLQDINRELDRLHLMLLAVSVGYLRMLREIGARSRHPGWGWR